MGEAKDGGPAFPLSVPLAVEGGEAHAVSRGMSLRDWFAGQSVAAITESAQRHARSFDSGDEMASSIARTAYGVADAMLAARALPSKGEV